MRTSIDIPDSLYRTLKTRAVMSGISLKDLVLSLLEQGIRQPSQSPIPSSGRREPPPIIITPRGIPIPATDMRRLEEDEDQAKHARSG